MHYEDIPWNLLDAEKGWNLNQYKVANKIESVGIPLFEFCQTRHGIATLSNKTYIFLPNKEDDTAFLTLRLILDSSLIRFDLLWRRPAVSAMTMS